MIVSQLNSSGLKKLKKIVFCFRNLNTNGIQNEFAFIVHSIKQVPFVSLMYTFKNE